jgi:FkbM family methyltransferase
MLARLERKLAEIQRWVDSVHGVADWPAAMALAMYRTRPRRGRPIWIRPAGLGGMAVRIQPSEMSEFVIYEEVFIDNVYDLDRVGFRPDVIVDAGAFHGYFSLLAAAKFPGVPTVAFEPNAQNLEALQANVRHNAAAVDIRAAAVSTRDGTALFAGGGCGGHLDAGASGAVQVSCVDLPRVIAALHAERLLLKIDIEGEESTVLPALLPVVPQRCAIFYEWHHDLAAHGECAALLAAHGFATTVIRERADDGVVYLDAFAQRG